MNVEVRVPATNFPFCPLHSPSRRKSIVWAHTRNWMWYLVKIHSNVDISGEMLTLTSQLLQMKKNFTVGDCWQFQMRRKNYQRLLNRMSEYCNGTILRRRNILTFISAYYSNELQSFVCIRDSDIHIISIALGNLYRTRYKINKMFRWIKKRNNRLN